MTFKEYLKSLLHHRPHCPKLDYSTKFVGAGIGASLMVGTAIAIGLLSIDPKNKTFINVRALPQAIPLIIGAILLYMYARYCYNKEGEY